MIAKKTALALRIGHFPDPAFFISWTALVASGLRTGDAILGPAVGMPHSCACNFLVSQFMKTDCDSMLFMDDDMVFKTHALNELRDNCDGFDIVSGMYTTRRDPIMPISLCRDGDDYHSIDLAPGLNPVDVVGLGFTLVSRQLIETVCNARNNEPFRWTNGKGEDGDFCEFAKSLGCRIAVNSSVVIGHRVAFTSTWDASRNLAEMKLESFGTNKE